MRFLFLPIDQYEVDIRHIRPYNDVKYRFINKNPVVIEVYIAKDGMPYIHKYVYNHDNVKNTVFRDLLDFILD